MLGGRPFGFLSSQLHSHERLPASIAGVYRAKCLGLKFQGMEIPRLAHVAGGGVSSKRTVVA